MSSVNELKAAVPFREWKNNNPVDHRNKPIDLEDDFALRFAYKNYLDGFINTIQSPLQKKGAVKSANRFLVEGFTSQEDLDEAIRRVSEVPYAEQEAELLENFLELRRNASGAGVMYRGDTGQTLETASPEDIFNDFDERGFSHLRFNELREKQARIEILKPNAAGEQEVLREDELEYLERFEDSVRSLVKSSQGDRLRTKLSDGILNVAIVDGALVTRDIAKEDIDAEVNRSIRAGAINPTLKEQVTDLLQNPRKLSIERQNTEEAERLIRSAPEESLLYGTLTAQIRQLRFSHLKPNDGQLHEFLTEDGVPTGQTKAVKGQYNEFVSDNYRDFLEDFRKLYPLRGHISDAEILNAARSVASGVAIENGVFNFHEKRSILFSGKKTRAEQSAERVKQNVYKDPVTGQTYIHPQLLVAKADFDNLVESKELVFQDVDEDGDRIFVNLDGKEDSEGRTQKDRLLATRKKTLDRMYDNMVDSIYDSTADIRNSWLDHISTTDLADARYKTDKSRGEILGEWLDTENGKNFYNRIGQSILQASGDLVGAISLVGGKAVNLITPGDDPNLLERTGSDILKGTAITREANKSIGRMFGQQATYVDDGVQFIAPLVVDLTATGVLAATTSPAGAAAYLSAAGSKAGIRSTAKAYAAGLTGGGLRTLLKEAGEESVQATVDKAIKKKLIKVAQPGKIIDAGSAVKIFEAAAKGMRSKRVMFPAMAAPAFLRSAGATYGDMHMLLKGATDADGKPLSAEEIEDRATGTAFLAGLITASTVIGLHSLGRVVGLGDKLGGLETWAARGGTTRGLRAILEKLRGKPYASLGEATKDITNKILKKGFSKMNYTVLKRTGGGVVAESLQEGTDAFLNTFARSLGAMDTSADDWDRPFLDRAKEGLLGAAYGAGLGALGGGARGVIESRANRGTMKESDEQRVRLELAKDIRKRTVARLKATGSTETANTVEEILAAMDEASPAPKVETDTDTDTKADSQADPQADADEAQEQLDAKREEQQAAGAAPMLQQFQDTEVGSQERTDVVGKLSSQFGTPKPALSQSPSPKALAEKSEKQLKEEEDSEFGELDRLARFLEAIGLGVLSFDMMAVIRDPKKYSLSERQAIISFIEEHTADKDLTQAQKEIVKYITHQLETGVTEAEANANVENSTPEQQNAAVEAGNAAQAAAEAAKKTSGTGATVVTPDAKKELIKAFVVGKGMTEEEATIEVEELMSQVRRDPQETEDLARIERDEPILKQIISSIKNGLAALKESAKQGLPGAYQGGVGQVYFTDKPTQGLIDTLGQRMADKAAVRRRSTDVGTHVAEMELLERLKNTLEDLLTLNRRKKELEPEPEESTPPAPEPKDADTEKYPKGTVVRSEIYKSEGDIEILKRKEDDDRGALYLALFSKSKRSGDISETAIDSIVSKPEPAPAAPESGTTKQDSGSPRKDTGIISEIDPKQKAKDELDTLVEEDIEAGALRRGSAKNSTRLMGTAVFGFPSRIKANSTDQKAAADRTYKGVNERYPLVQFDEAGKGLTTEADVRASLQAILGEDKPIPDEQWRTLKKTTVQFSKTEIYTIEDTEGGIFDEGNGIGGTNDRVVLFNNDPRAMKVALDQVLDVDSILIPKDFPREKVNPTFRADREGNEPAAREGVVRSVYYPVGDGIGSEVRADGNYTQKRTSSPDELVATAAQKINTLLEFIDTGVRIDVSLNKDDPTSIADRVEESITIAQIINRLSAHLDSVIGSGDQAPVSNRVRAKFDKGVLKNLYGLDIFAQGRLYAVEVAILQAVANKSTGQTNEEAIMSLFKKGEKDLSGLTKATGKTQSDFANDNELFGFVLSNFLGRGIPAKKDQNVFDAVVDWVSSLSRHKGAQTEEGRRTSDTPTPNLRTGKSEIDSKLNKSKRPELVEKSIAESKAPVQPAEVSVAPDTGIESDEDASPPPAPKRPDVSTLEGVGPVKVGTVVDEIITKMQNFLAVTQAEVIRRFATALQEQNVIDLRLANDQTIDDLEIVDLTNRFEEAIRSLPEGWAKNVPNDVRTAQQDAVNTLGTAMRGSGTVAPSQGAAALILYLYKINAMGGDLNPEAAPMIVNAAGMEADPTSVVEMVNRYRKKSEEQNAPNFLDKKFVERIKEMNVQEILELGLENRNVESLINVLKNAGPEHRMAADLLLQFEDYIRTNLTPVTTEAGNHFAGSFNPTTGEVTVNVNGRYGDGVISVVIHEVGHAVFQKIITTPDAELTSGQRAAKKQMQVIYDRARKQWENSKKRGIANRNLDYVFETGRQTVRMVGPSGVVAASGDLPFYAGADETTLDASQAATKGTAGSDVILPAARGFEEFFTSWLSASDFQDATRRIAIGDRSLFRRIIDAIKTMFSRQTGVEKQQIEVVETIYNFAKMKGSRDLTRSFEATRDSIIKAVQQEVDRVGLTRGLSADLAKRMSEGLVDGPEFDLYNAYLDDFIKAREEGRSGDEEAYLADQVMFTQILKDEVSRQVPTGVRVVFTNAEDLRSRGLGYKAFQPTFTEESTIVEDGVRKRITQINFDLDAMQNQVDLIGDVTVLSATSGPIIDLMSEEGRAKATERFRLAARRVRDEIELSVLEETVHTVDNLVIPDAEKQALLEEVGIDALVESYKNYLQVSDRFNYLNPETRSRREAEAEPKLQALRDGDSDEVRHALSEMIRMDVQRIVKGATTESVDAAAIEGLSSPYVTALNRQLTKVAARLGPMLRGERNSNYQQVVQRIVGAMKALERGQPESVGFVPFDVNNPDGNIEVILDAFDKQSDLFKKISDPDASQQERMAVAQEVRQRQIDFVELTIKMKNGKFDGAATLKGIKKYARRLSIGMQDPRIQDLIKHIQLWAEGMGGQIESDVLVLKSLENKAYPKRNGGTPDNILIALNTASGTTDSLDLDPEVKENLDAAYRAVVRRIKKEVAAGQRPRTDSEPEALQSIRRALYTIPVEQARVEKVKEAKEKQKQAYDIIYNDTRFGPKLVEQIKKIRMSLDASSRKIAKNYNLGEVAGGKVKLIFDRQEGVYLTRRYRAYDDLAYLKEVQDPNGKYKGRRDVALGYFEEARVEVIIKEKLREMRGLIERLKVNVPFTNAEQEAEAKRVKSLSPAERMDEAKTIAIAKVADEQQQTIGEMNTFLKALEEKITVSESNENISAVRASSSPKVRALLKLDTDALKNKAQVDPRIRYLLGQYGLDTNEDGTYEEKGLAALEQTFYAVTRMVEQSSFFSQLKEIGGVVDGDFENAFVFTLQEALDAKLDGAEYKNARTGKLLSEYIQDAAKNIETDEEGVQTVKNRDMFDFSYDMFIPKDAFDAFKLYREKGRSSLSTEIGAGATVVENFKDGKYVTGTLQAGLKATEFFNAMFLVSKTIFNAPVYHARNIFTALTTYGAGNGVGPVAVSVELARLFLSKLNPLRSSKTAPERRPGSRDELSATEYRMLGLDQKTLAIGQIQQQLTGGQYSSATQLFLDSMAELTEESQKSRLAKAKKIAVGAKDQTVGRAYDTVAAFAQAIDAATKIAIYKKEKKVLNRAKLWDKSNGVDTGYVNMSEMQMMQEAAKTTRSVAPTFSEAPKFARSIRKWNPIAGDAFSGFFLDQFRIFRNQLLGTSLRETQSKNPIIQANGRKRQLSSMVTHGSFSAATVLTTISVLKMFLSRDEEELLEANRPSYLRNNSYVYMKGSDLINLGLNDVPQVLDIFSGLPDEIDPDKVYAMDITYINGMSPVVDGTQQAIVKMLAGFKSGDVGAGITDAGLRLWASYLERFLGQTFKVSPSGELEFDPTDALPLGQIPNTIANLIRQRDPDGRPLYNRKDTSLKKMEAVFDKVIVDTLAPAQLEKLYRYYKLRDADDPNVRMRAEQIASSALSPIKVRPIDPTRGLQNKAYEINRDREDVRNAIFAELKDGKTTLKDADFERLAERAIRHTVVSDTKLIDMINTSRRFEESALRLSEEQIAEALKVGGIGPARVSGLMAGKTERYRPSVAYYTSLVNKGEFGEERARKFDTVIQRMAQEFRFEDVITGQGSDTP